METDFAQLKEKHLSVKCSKHSMKINAVSVLPDKTCRLLCKLCKDKVMGEKIHHLVDLFDDDIPAILEDKVQSQSETPASVQDRYGAVFEKIGAQFATLKSEFNERIQKAEEELKTKFINFIEEADQAGSGGVNWADIKSEFMKTRESFAKSQPGQTGQELIDYMQQYDGTMNRLSLGDDADKPNAEFEINTDSIDALSKSLDTSFKTIETKFFRFKLIKGVSVDVSKIKEENTLTLPSKGVFKAITSLEDLDLVAVGGTDGILSFLDAETYKVKSSFKAHRTFITGIDYIPSRNQLVTCSLDRTIKVFNIKDGEIKESNSFALQGHKSFIYCVKYLPDINRLASVGYDPEIKLWDLDAKKEVDKISTNGWASDSYEIMYIPDEGLIGLVGKDIIKIFNYNKKALVKEIKTDELSMNSIQYSTSNKCFYAAVKPGVIRVWEVNGESIEQKDDIKFDAIGETPYTLLSIEEQGLIVATTRSKFVCFVNVFDGKVIQKKTELTDAIGCTVVRKKSQLLIGDNKSNKMVVLSLA